MLLDGYALRTGQTWAISFIYLTDWALVSCRHRYLLKQTDKAPGLSHLPAWIREECKIICPLGMLWGKCFLGGSSETQ